MNTTPKLRATASTSPSTEASRYLPTLDGYKKYTYYDVAHIVGIARRRERLAADCLTAGERGRFALRPNA